MKTKILLHLLCGTLLYASASQASVSITLHGTVAQDDTINLYTVGESVSYTFEISSTFDPSNATTSYNGSRQVWGTKTAIDDSLWSDVSGSKLTGTWQQSVNFPFDEVDSNFNDDKISLIVGSSTNDFIGLFAGGGVVREIAFEGQFTGLDFLDPGAATDPNTYFSDYAGSYSVIPNAGIMQLTAVTGDILFDITSMDITVVPEPASAAALLGLAAVGFVVARRRKV